MLQHKSGTEVLAVFATQNLLVLSSIASKTPELEIKAEGFGSNVATVCPTQLGSRCHHWVEKSLIPMVCSECCGSAVISRSFIFQVRGSTILYINESKGEILPIRKNVFASHVRCILRF